MTPLRARCGFAADGSLAPAPLGLLHYPSTIVLRWLAALCGAPRSSVQRGTRPDLFGTED
jgi:hypothetical protein